MKLPNLTNPIRVGIEISRVDEAGVESAPWKAHLIGRPIEWAIGIVVTLVFLSIFL